MADDDDDRKKLVADLAAKNDIVLQKFKVELDALMQKYGVELVSAPAFTNDGRVVTQVGFKVK